MTEPTETQRQAILSTIEEWATARGCGTLRERMNAALDALETDPSFDPAWFDFAYGEAKKILERGRAD
jgi:hypothetical protein